MPAPFCRKLVWPVFVWCLFFFPLSSVQRQCGVRPLATREIPPRPSHREIVIAAVGDIMMPSSIQSAAARHKNGYHVFFDKIAKDFAGADITFANLETPVDDRSNRSGYPKFNAHPGLLAALRKTGVTVLSVANNHAMDAGSRGLKRTIDNIEAAGLIFIGAGRTRAEAEEIKFIKARDVIVAFLAYAYGSNERLPKPGPDSPALNIIRTGSEQDLNRAARDVRRARAYADLVVVSMHWGNEYAGGPSKWQRRAAAAMVEAGADMVFGHHPHVLQPVESIAAGDGRMGLVAFSLGNFISSQAAGISYAKRNDTKTPRGEGIILFVTAVKESSAARVDRAEFVPIWTLREPVGGKVLHRPVSLYREIAVLQAKGVKSELDENLLQFLTVRKESIIQTIISRPGKKYL